MALLKKRQIDVLIVNFDQVQDSAHLLNVFITEFQHVFTC